MPDAATGSVTLAISSVGLASRRWRRVRRTMASPPRIKWPGRLTGPGSSGRGQWGPLGTRASAAVARHRTAPTAGWRYRRHRLVPTRAATVRGVGGGGVIDARRARSVRSGQPSCAGPPGRPCPGQWWRQRRPPRPGRLVGAAAGDGHRDRARAGRGGPDHPLAHVLQRRALVGDGGPAGEHGVTADEALVAAGGERDRIDGNGAGDSARASRRSRPRGAAGVAGSPPRKRGWRSAGGAHQPVALTPDGGLILEPHATPCS